MKSTKFKWRYLFLSILMLVAGLYAFDVFQSWKVTRFPSTSSFAKYLPEGANATRYEFRSVGLQDYFIEFEASGTREDFDQFVENLLESLPNGTIDEQLYSWINGVPQFTDDIVKISADHEIGVELHWYHGRFTMFFAKT